MGVPRIELTEKVLSAVRFERQIVASSKGGVSTIPTPKDVRLWVVKDSKLEGFCIRVSPGAVGWYVRKRIPGRGQLLRCMGNYPELSADKARKRASVWLGMMSSGIDPLQEKKALIREGQVAAIKDKRTLGVVFAEYITKKAAKNKQSTSTDRAKVVGWMKTSPLWHMSIFDINDAAVESTFGPLRDYLKGGRKPTWGPQSISPGTFNKIFVYLSGAFMREALEHRIVLSKNDGPFVRWRSDQALPKSKPKESFLPIHADIGKHWLQSLVELQKKAHDPKIFIERPDPRSKDVKPHAGVLVDFFLCVLLWGSRKEETAKLRWQDVNFEDRIVVFEESTTKSGKAGAVPLTPWAVEILKARKKANDLWRPDEDSPWVFPSRIHDKPISNPRGIAEDLSKLTGLMITPHDLRRTLATDLNREPVRLEELGKLLIAGAALNHSRGATGGTASAATYHYLKEQIEALRPAFQARENQLRRVIGLPIFAAAEVDDGVEAEGQLQAFLAKAKSDPEMKRRLKEALLG